MFSGLVRFSNGSIAVIVAGGFHDRTYLQSSEILYLDQQPSVWQLGPDLPKPIMNAECVPFRDTFLITGGSHDLTTYSNEIIEFDIASNDWIIRQERFLSRREEHAAFLIPDEVARCT